MTCLKQKVGKLQLCTNLLGCTALDGIVQSQIYVHKQMMLIQEKHIGFILGYYNITQKKSQ